MVAHIINNLSELAILEASLFKLITMKNGDRGT
jgi:hypothetical protein